MAWTKDSFSYQFLFAKVWQACKNFKCCLHCICNWRKMVAQMIFIVPNKLMLSQFFFGKFLSSPNLEGRKKCSFSISQRCFSFVVSGSSYQKRSFFAFAYEQLKNIKWEKRFSWNKIIQSYSYFYGSLYILKSDIWSIV